MTQQRTGAGSVVGSLRAVDGKAVIEAELSPDGDQTRLVVEERGLPRDAAAAHSAGWQAHIEDLAANPAGEPPTAWLEPTPTCRDQARDLG